MRERVKCGRLGCAALLLLAAMSCATNEPARRAGEARPRMTAAPAAKTPNLMVTLGWSTQTLTLPPPIDAERHVFSSPQYRRWQFQDDSGDFVTTDTQGYGYRVRTAAKGKSLRLKTENGGAEASPSASAGASSDVLGGFGVKMIVSRLRPDGTLENMTAYRSDGSVDGWIAYGPDGRTRLVRVQLRGQEYSPSGAPLIQSVYLYDPDRIRQLIINDRNEAWQELAIGASGASRGVLHEEPSKADRIRRLQAGGEANATGAPRSKGKSR